MPSAAFRTDARSEIAPLIPKAARQSLGLQAGDELLMLCKPDRVIIVPKPKKFAKRTAGLHREVWQGADAYLANEHKDW